MKIEFDENKDNNNKEKHKDSDGVGLSLAFGEEVLSDSYRVDAVDTRYDYGEERIVCYGKVNGRVYVLCLHRASGHPSNHQRQERKQ